MTVRKSKRIMGALLAVSAAGMAIAAEQTNAPVSVSGTWYFTQKVNRENYARIPKGCKKFEFDQNHGIDLDKIAGKKGKLNDECLIYREFDLEQETDSGFGIGADWRVEVYLNGEKIFSTFSTGNILSPFSPDDYSFTGKFRKGRNLLAVRIRRGSNSWEFQMKGKTYASAYVSAFPAAPVTITIDPEQKLGKIKPMNAVNNGPIQGAHGRGNMELWKAAAIPYTRNHDASFCYSYGGEHTVDVHAIFPDFSKDPNDPASYDFTLTDEYLQRIQGAGTKVFYRLGSKIEHEAKKYGTKVPPDFKKWAVICEHIIRHYTEGWATGFKWDIEYWEIWNEPDFPIGKNGSSTWQGTEEQFFEFYRVAATHLKKCFPKLKIGGPAVMGIYNPWCDRFLAAMTAGDKRVPIDFFSWHVYAPDPRAVKARIFAARQLLDKFGYTKTESILDEWNYLRYGDGEQFKYTIQTIIGLKGAAYAASVMCTGQDTPVDMLMYYDARPSVWNGIFDFYNYEPLKTYYVFLAWAKLVKLSRQIAVDTQGKVGIYAVGASDGGKTGVLISRYFEDDKLPEDLPVKLSLKKGTFCGAKLYLIDETHDLAEIPYRTDSEGNLLFDMKANTVVYLENAILKE